MTATRSKLEVSVVVAVATIAVAYIAILLIDIHGANSLKADTDAFLSDVFQIYRSNWDISSIEDLQRKYPKHFTGTVCGAETCDINFAFDNSSLRLLHLGNPTHLYVAFGIRKTRFSALTVSFTNGDRSVVSVKVSDALMDPQEPHRKIFVDNRRNGFGMPWATFIRVSPEASTSELRYALNINSACFRTFGGCKDASKLIPATWTQ